MALATLVACATLTGCRGAVSLSQPGANSLANDRDFDWNAPVVTDNFAIYAERGSSAAAAMPVFRTDVEIARSEVLTFLGQTRYDRVTIFVVEDKARMKALTGLEINATSFYKTNVIALVYGQLPPATVGHEMVHLVATNRWGVPDRWINEGVAVAFDGRVGEYQVHNLAKYLLEQGELPSLDDITRNFTRLPNRASYPAAGSFASFLIERYGRRAAKDVYNEGRRGLRPATGATVEELEQQWHERLQQANASGIVWEVGR